MRIFGLWEKESNREVLKGHELESMLKEYTHAEERLLYAIQQYTRVSKATKCTAFKAELHHWLSASARSLAHLTKVRLQLERGEIPTYTPELSLIQAQADLKYIEEYMKKNFPEKL